MATQVEAIKAYSFQPLVACAWRPVYEHGPGYAVRMERVCCPAEKEFHWTRSKLLPLSPSQSPSSR